MSTMLWKTLALGGVIGVGSVVVVQAKRSLDAVPATAATEAAEDEFELLDPETGLETSFDGDVAAAPPNALPRPADAEPLAALTPLGPEEIPFDSGPEPAQIAQASAEIPGNPFAVGETGLEPDQDEPASTVTLDEPDQEQFALLDGQTEPVVPEQSQPNPFEVTSATPLGEPPAPLRKLSPGNDGPVLRQTPAEESEEAHDPDNLLASAPDDNPFSQFVRPPRAGIPEQPGPAEPAATFPSTPETQPEAGPPSFDAAPELSAPPPLRTREPAGTASIDLPPATLDPPESTGLRSREAPPQAEPEIASPQEAGLAAPQAPKLPEVSLENAPGRVRVAEADLAPVEESSAPLPPLNLTGGEAQPAPESAPSEISSIPRDARPVPQDTRSSIPVDRTVPNVAIDPAGVAAPGLTSNPPPQTNFNSFNPDESSTARPPESDPFGSSIPGSAGPPESPFDNAPPSSIPEGPPSLPAKPATPAPAAQPDLTGTGVIDRNVATGPAQPQLTIIKQAPKEAVVGQDLEYSIHVKNIGRSSAHNVVVEDLIPRGSKCTGTIPKAESQLEKKNLVWKLGTLAAGQEHLIRVRITPTDAGEIGSVATVSFSAEVAAKTVIVEPKAVLTLAGPRDAVVGEPAQYRFTVSNNGPVDLKGVFVRTVLPGEGLTHPGGNDLEYEVGELRRGQSREVALAITPSQKGNWKFDAMVTLGGRELAKAQADVQVVGARLTVVRTGPTKRFVGRPATFSNTVTNNSSQVLGNVVVVETLPVGLEPSGQLANGARWDAARRTLTWTIPQLAPGQALDLPCTVVPTTAGDLQGQIVARDSSGNQAEIATALEVAGFSSLVVDGGHDGRPVAVGDQVSFRFSVKNRGTAPAEKVVAMFDLPDEVEFVSAQGPANVDFEKTGRLIVFEPVPIVPVNGELTFDVVVQAKSATGGSSRIQVSLNSNQLPADRPLEQEQQLVIYGDDDEPQPVQRVSGIR